jgi:hypothetical protein
MLELWIFTGTQLEPNWEKYSSMFDDQMFDVYEGRKVDIAIIEAGQDSQGEHYLNRVLARSKVDVDERDSESNQGSTICPRGSNASGRNTS